MTYKIKKYSLEQAKKLGVSIKPSTNPKKKLDVFKDGKKVVSIGASGYGDFPSYLEKDKEVALERRRLYKKRHEKYRNIKGTPSFYADKILW